MHPPKPARASTVPRPLPLQTNVPSFPKLKPPGFHAPPTGNPAAAPRATAQQAVTPEQAMTSGVMQGSGRSELCGGESVVYWQLPLRARELSASELTI